MRILVTGGAGYIGSHTVRQLLAGGHEVTVFDSLEYGHRPAVPAANLVVGDLRDIEHLDQLMVVNRIEAVMHFAAYTSVPESVKSPSKYYTNNVVYSLQLLDRCRRNGVERFVFSSTAAVYGLPDYEQPDAIPIKETARKEPVNPYGATKLAFERALEDYAFAHPFGYCALRYFNAAGAASDGSIGEDHTPETHLIPIVIQAALGKRPHVEIYGTDYNTPDGTCVRDYVHVDDLASAHVLALEKLGPGKKMAYNVGIGRGYSVREVIAAVEAVSGRTVPVKEAPRRAGDPPVLVASPARIRAELGWQPQYTNLKAIVETAWRWHQSHPNGFGE